MRARSIDVCGESKLLVLIVPEKRLAAVAARQHVLKRAGVFESNLSRHCSGLLPRRKVVKICGLTHGLTPIPIPRNGRRSLIVSGSMEGIA